MTTIYLIFNVYKIWIIIRILRIVCNLIRHALMSSEAIYRHHVIIGTYMHHVLWIVIKTLGSSIAPQWVRSVAIAEAKQRSQWSVLGWVTKIYYLELLRASEGTWSRWSRLHSQSFAYNTVSRRVDVTDFRSTEELEIINFDHPSNGWPRRTMHGFRVRTLCALTARSSKNTLILQRNKHF
jgi:hypothetical protein